MATQDLTLQLPSIPKDCYYEDYVAAILNAGGYYLDRSVHRTEDGLDLLELDVVATKFGANDVKNTIIEVKSGGWGVKDLFKVNGWLNYLGNQKAAFIYQQSPNKKDEATMQDFAKGLNIDLLSNPIQADGTIDNSIILNSFGISLINVPESVLKAFRYAYNLERMMLDFINKFSKDNAQYATPKRVYNYFRALIDKSFFIYNPVKRLRFLTDQYVEYKNIACILDNELKDGIVYSADQCNLFRNLFEIENPPVMQLRPVDVALHVQLLNRLFVIKSMTEYLSKPSSPNKNQIQDWMEKLEFIQLHNNISYGIEKLKGHSHFYLYPYFYQVFFYVFGGFFMKSKKDEEYRLLSQLTGLPVSEIDMALKFWDEIYHTSNSWMQWINHGGLYYMKFVPSPLRGIGVNFRRHLYAPIGVTDSDALFKNLLNISDQKSYNDMIHWNNMAYTMLKQDQNLHAISSTGVCKFDIHLESVKHHIQNLGIYTKVNLLSDMAQAKNCSNFKVNGYFCVINSEQYDLYIVKPDNNLLSFPINQVVRELRLDQGHLHYCYVLGTDENKQKEIDDNIWFTCLAHRANISHLDQLVDEANKLS